jgi:predicted RNA-binding Zn-ribbon protein involved in translation (DUF1610 family)
MPDRPWKDEYTLLCEKCGYVIEGLETDGNCPECGKPIVESLPERRVGTPWQQKPGVGSLVRTWWMTLRHPLRTLDVMRIQPVRLSSVIINPFLLLALLFFATFFMPALFLGIESLILLILLPVYLGIGSILVFLTIGLMRVESLGLRTISRQRGFRITKDISRQIVAHGSIGWVIVFAGMCNFWNFYLLSKFLTNSENNTFNQLNGVAYVAGLTTLVVSFLAGFLFFETFAYLGLRRLKYANRIGPDSGSEPMPETQRTT